MKYSVFLLFFISIFMLSCEKNEEMEELQMRPRNKIGYCDYACPNGWQVVSGIMCPGNGYEVCIEPFECRPQMTNACSNTHN